MTGLRVLEIANDTACAYAGLVLSGLGAEVIKIEAPGTGDALRHREPFLAPGIGAAFAAYNLGKKSVTLDLSSPRAREALYRLVQKADAVLENLGPGRANQLGVGYEALKSLKTDLVYGAVSGYGPAAGPYQNRTCNETVAQAQFGMMATTGEDRDSEPIRTGFPVPDIGTGLNTAFSVVVALWHRQRTGQGQRIDATLMHTQMGFAGHVATQQDFARADPTHARALCLQLAPYQAYRTQDSWVVVATSNEAQWNRICTLPEYAAMGKDPRFRTMRLRVKNRVALTACFEEIFAGRSASHVEAMFEKIDVPCTRVNTLRDIYADPFFRDATLDQIDIPGHRSFTVPKLPFFVPMQPSRPRSPPPSLGEHNHSVLGSLGYSPEAVAAICAPRDAGKR